MKQKILAVPLKKKRLARTNYRRRLQLLSSGKPRLVVRRTLNHVLLQLIRYEQSGDKVLLSAHSRELAKKGWTTTTGNVPAAYLTGLLFATKAKKKDLNQAVVDIGFHASVRGSRVYAALRGVVEGGFPINVDKKVFPSDERIQGKHIVQYAAKHQQMKASATALAEQFERMKAEVQK